MSYTEYFDLYRKAQKIQCDYGAFLIDVKDSRKCLKDAFEYQKFHNCVDYITEKLLKLEKKFCNQILLQDKDNLIMKFNNNSAISDFHKTNPMCVGDCACFFVKNHIINDKQFTQILLEAIELFDINFAFHYLSAQYQTNEYAKGGTQLCKVYMLPIMEDLSKSEGLLIDKKYIEKLKNNEQIL